MAINELRSTSTSAEAVELGSLRQATAPQGMKPQAASQALAQLERHLGGRLFHRTTRSLALADEGKQFLEAAQPALAGATPIWSRETRFHELGTMPRFAGRDLTYGCVEPSVT
jgi:DNA-binding transcriptional LysR family regulator